MDRDSGSMCGNSTSTGTSKGAYQMFRRTVGAGALLLVGLIGIGSAPATAQVQRSGGGGGGGASAALMQQYQQLSAERVQLRADNDKLKKDLDDTKKQLDAANKQLAAFKARAGQGQAVQAALVAAQTSKEGTEKKLADTEAKMKQLVDRFRETVAAFRVAEDRETRTKQDLAAKTSDLNTCVQRNAQLYQVTNEILDRYQKEGPFSRLARVEPFTRIKRTQVDNLALEYRQKADEQRVNPPPATGATPPPAPTPATSATPPPAPAAPPPAPSSSGHW